MAENTFVIRVWCEHSESESIKPQFRGVIEHVISGRRQYLSNSQGITQFIQNHLPHKSQKSENESNSITQWIDQQK